MTRKSCHTCTHNRARHSGCDDCGAAMDWAAWEEAPQERKSIANHLAALDAAESRPAVTTGPQPGTPEWGAMHRETHRAMHQQMEVLRRQYPGYGTPGFVVRAVGIMEG